VTQSIAIEKLTLHSLEQQFGLSLSEDENFFFEWQSKLPAIGEFEQDRLARIKAIYKNMEKEHGETICF